MKALSIQQPWGQYVAAGIKDVENRTWPVRNFPMRVLIHVGKKKQVNDLSEQPPIFNLIVDNAEHLGIVPDIEDMPTGAVIGVVDIVGCTENASGNPSPWAEWAEDGAEITVYNLQLSNARLFKEPIFDIKGKQGFFEIPEITEDNLPECVATPQIRREGTELFIPCHEDDLDEYSEMEEPITWDFNLFDSNLPLFTKETEEGLEELETTHITFFNGDRKVRMQVLDQEVSPIEEDGKTVTYEGAREQELEWWKVFYTFLPEDMDASEFTNEEDEEEDVDEGENTAEVMTMADALSKLDDISRTIINVLEENGLPYDFEKDANGQFATISSHLTDRKGETQFIEFHVNLELKHFFMNMTKEFSIPKKSMKRAIENSNFQNSERAAGYVFIDPTFGNPIYRDSLYVCDGTLSPKAVELMLMNGQYEIENIESELLKS